MRGIVVCPQPRAADVGASLDRTEPGGNGPTLSHVCRDLERDAGAAPRPHFSTKRPQFRVSSPEWRSAFPASLP